MKEKVVIDNLPEINYIRELIERDLKQLEMNLVARQKILQKFNERSGK